MSDEDDDINEDDMAAVLPAAVRDAYQEEAEWIAARVAAHAKAGESWIQKALTWVPYIDSVFEEQDIDIAAATSDVNRDGRVRLVIEKIEKGLGFELDAQTRANVRSDVWAMYSKTMEEL